MGKLTARGWATRTPVIDAAEAQAFMDRCQQSHAAQWKLDVSRWEDGENVTLAVDVPVVGGSLIIDSSDPIRRSATLECGVGEAWFPDDRDSPLVPFGQWVALYVRIDRQGGGWFPWLKLMEGPIQTNVFERPSLITTIEVTDASQTVDDFLYLKRRSYAAGRTLKSITKEVVDDALPTALYTVRASDHATFTELAKPFHVDAGESRWDAVQRLLGARAGHQPQEAFFDGLGDLIIRRDITDEDDATWNPSEPGPDIGTVQDPVAVLRDGIGGNVVGTTASLTRDGAVNATQINLTAVVNRRRKGAAHAIHKELWYSTGARAGGTIAYGDSFGRLPLVETTSVDKLTAKLKQAADRKAQRLLTRRRGLIKYLDLDTLPLYWVEPDDKVRVQVGGRTEHHYVQRVELPLDGSPMRIRTRIASVTDPGAPVDPEGWELPLPMTTRTMVKAGQTTPLPDAPLGFEPLSGDWSNHSTAELTYEIARAVFYPDFVWAQSAAWDCAWQHAYGGERSVGIKWNCPPTDDFWNGAGCCEALHPLATGANGASATAQVPGWYAQTYESGGATSLSITSCSLSSWIDYSNVWAVHISPLGPSAGNPDPTPPPGMSLEWEDPDPTVVLIEAAMTEPVGATNAGTMYCRKFSGVYGSEWGPDPANPTGWAIGGFVPGSSPFPGYDGGEQAWTDVTNLIEPTGKTWFVWVPDILEEQARKWDTGRLPGDLMEELRAGLSLAFRFTIRPSRYRFV